MGEFREFAHGKIGLLVQQIVPGLPSHMASTGVFMAIVRPYVRKSIHHWTGTSVPRTMNKYIKHLIHLGNVRVGCRSCSCVNCPIISSLVGGGGLRMATGDDGELS